MEFQQIRYEVTDRVLTLTLDRPERLNAWTRRMGDEIAAAFDRADADDDVRVIVVTGAGRGFCAGMDLAAGADDHRDGGGRVSLAIYASKKPVIAAINGPAVGVGVTMTLPMDIRLASADARLGFVFTRRGLVPEACSSWFLPRIVGIARAMEWVATGRVFDATEALEGGLVRSVHAGPDLLPAAHDLAREIADNAAPVSVAMSRRLLWTMLGADGPLDAHRAESLAMLSRGRSGDAREGVAAFLQKRAADFPDRVSTWR